MIKTFEKFYANKPGIYYKIFIDGSLEKFKIVLKKLGYYEDFKYDWGIEDFEYDITDENLEYFNKDVIFLFIRQRYSENKNEFFVNDEDIFDSTLYKCKYIGEVHVEDFELKADKYNL